MPEVERGPQDVVKQTLERQGDAEGSIVVLYHRDMDHSKIVGEYWAGHLSNNWLDQVNKKLKEGFVPFHIQTQFGLTGHETHIYMVKMKE